MFKIAEFSSNQVQTVNLGETIIFTENPLPCRRGLVRHRDDTGNFLLKGYVPRQYGCPCCRSQLANYLVDFGANIAIPTGGTVGAISVAITIDGATIPASTILEKTREAIEEHLQMIIRKNSNMTPMDIEIITKDICALEALKRIENVASEGYSEESSGNSGYSGHSIQDRMVDKLERMIDEAQTENERKTVREWIQRLRS